MKLSNEMKTVELPLVPSKRSSTSSTAPCRTRVYSSGLVKSVKTGRSMPRQCQHEDENPGAEDDDEGLKKAQQEEDPQEPSGEDLWDEVEQFLSKPSPTFSTLPVHLSNPIAIKPMRSTLPTLYRKNSPLDNQGTSSTRRSARVIATGAKTIDQKLLQEAFMYAHQLQHLHVDDEDGDKPCQSFRCSKTMQLQCVAPHSSSSSSLSSGSSTAGSNRTRGNERKRTQSSSSVGHDGPKSETRSTILSVYSSATKRRPVARGKRSTREDSPASARSEFYSKGQGHMDPQTLQSLIEDFQNGTSLEELRKELAASQESMALSRQVLQEATRTFFCPR